MPSSLLGPGGYRFGTGKVISGILMEWYNAAASEPTMSLTIHLNLPPDIEERLRSEGRDVSAEVKEAYVLDLFRRGGLTHVELSRALGLDRVETDAWLKQHRVIEGSLTMDDLNRDRTTLDEVMRKAG